MKLLVGPASARQQTAVGAAETTAQMSTESATASTKTKTFSLLASPCPFPVNSFSSPMSTQMMANVGVNGDAGLGNGNSGASGGAGLTYIQMSHLSSGASENTSSSGMTNNSSSRSSSASFRSSFKSSFKSTASSSSSSANSSSSCNTPILANMSAKVGSNEKPRKLDHDKEAGEREEREGGEENNSANAVYQKPWDFQLIRSLQLGGQQQSLQATRYTKIVQHLRRRLNLHFHICVFFCVKKLIN